MKVNISEEIQNSSSLAGHLILHGLTEVLKDKEFSKFVSSNTIKDEGCVVDIKLTVNSVELPFMSFVKAWDRQTDSLISDTAKDLIRDRFNDLLDLLYDLEERVRPEIEKRLEGWEKS